MENKGLYYLIVFASLFLLSLLVIPLVLMLFFPASDGNLLYLRTMASYPAALMIVNRMMKKSSCESLFSMIMPIRKGLFIAVFIAVCSLSLASSLLEGSIIKNRLPLSTLLLSFLISIIFIPLQCTAEEIIFRILPQKILLRNSFDSPWIMKSLTALLSSAFFSSLHMANSEALLFESRALSFSYYFLSGALLCTLTYIERGYTSAISYHTANNLFVTIVMNRAEESTLASSPFFLRAGDFNDYSSIFSLIAAIIVTVTVVTLYRIRQIRREQIG